MSGKFEVFIGKDEQLYFRLKAGNGENILGSQGYKSKKGVLKGIESVRKNSTVETHFVRNTSENGKFSFSLKAQNGEIIGTSQIYKTEQGRDHGIVSVQNNASNAVLLDLTEAL